jgi:hypothetical protein
MKDNTLLSISKSEEGLIAEVNCNGEKDMMLCVYGILKILQQNQGLALVTQAFLDTLQEDEDFAKKFLDDENFIRAQKVPLVFTTASKLKN